jgi:hypothetical protein
VNSEEVLEPTERLYSVTNPDHDYSPRTRLTRLTSPTRNRRGATQWGCLAARACRRTRSIQWCSRSRRVGCVSRGGMVWGLLQPAALARVLRKMPKTIITSAADAVLVRGRKRGRCITNLGDLNNIPSLVVMLSAMVYTNVLLKHSERNFRLRKLRRLAVQTQTVMRSGRAATE